MDGVISPWFRSGLGNLKAVEWTFLETVKLGSLEFKVGPIQSPVDAS